MFNTFSTWTDSEPDVFEFADAFDFDQEVQDQLINSLFELTGRDDIEEIVHEFGLGFVEEHGFHTGTMVDFISDPSNFDSWVFGFSNDQDWFRCPLVDFKQHDPCDDSGKQNIEFY